eukprot:CAMPEP_0182428586 /NCGR_PEP_ID=MMETSP1167-20130531/23130_1 /TAXON_ID=2988 /ORGANISM="Mallomonas Sp, Strain CCMP3275" /LENGTH=421 /DNA_ID=CAMNT_0024611559 /DNA_START=245 /DNA_END=1510 /DNA_ORIENTATION=-
MILLSYAISFIGSYVAVALCEQYRLASINAFKKHDEKLNPLAILAMVAVSIGVVAVWCMHFVGMAAIDLHTSDGSKINIGYDVGLTIASIFSVVICVFLGLLVASRDRAYTKTKEQILDMIVDDAQRSGVKITSKLQVVVLASLKGVNVLILGGFITAGGVCLMHYLGMMSQRFEAHMEWDIGIIALSVAIAFAVSVVAFWILFRLLALYPYLEWLRVASALVMGLAVNSMHYTGMYGAKYYYDPSKSSDTSSNMIMSTGEAFGYALLIAFAISWTLNIITMRDMRQRQKYCSDVISKTDDIFAMAAKAPGSTVGQFVSKYMDVRGISFNDRAPFSVEPSQLESKVEKNPMREPLKSPSFAVSRFVKRDSVVSTGMNGLASPSSSTKIKIENKIPKKMGSRNHAIIAVSPKTMDTSIENIV